MGVGAALIGSAVVSSAAGAIGSSAASSAQQAGAKNATNAEMGMYNTYAQNLQPYMNLGTAGAQGLTNNLTSLTSPITMNQSQLEQTPGYQFQMAQGLKATQNGATAQGLGLSGAAQKSAASYASGLASTNYQQQFNNAVTNQTNQFSHLMGLTELGQSATNSLGAAGITTGGEVANNIWGGANAQAAGYMGIANSIAGGANSLGGAAMAGYL